MWVASANGRVFTMRDGRALSDPMRTVRPDALVEFKKIKGMLDGNPDLHVFDSEEEGCDFLGLEKPKKTSKKKATKKKVTRRA